MDRNLVEQGKQIGKEIQTGVRATYFQITFFYTYKKSN